jgi:hypothetical protein
MKLKILKAFVLLVLNLRNNIKAVEALMGHDFIL